VIDVELHTAVSGQSTQLSIFKADLNLPSEHITHAVLSLLGSVPTGQMSHFDEDPAVPELQTYPVEEQLEFSGHKVHEDWSKEDRYIPVLQWTHVCFSASDSVPIGHGSHPVPVEFLL